MKLGAATVPVYLVGTIWAVFIADLLLPGHLNAHGIVPRTIRGLFGILSTNFLHANFRHLTANTVPLFILSLVTVFFYRRIFVDVMLIIIAVGGSLVWLLARPANHIGASMLIYGLVAFLVAYGLVDKKPVPVLVSLIVGLTYGAGMLGGMLPVHCFVSWEAHLFGAMGGVAAARLLGGSED